MLAAFEQPMPTPLRALSGRISRRYPASLLVPWALGLPCALSWCDATVPAITVLLCALAPSNLLAFLREVICPSTSIVLTRLSLGCRGSATLTLVSARLMKLSSSMRGSAAFRRPLRGSFSSSAFLLVELRPQLLSTRGSGLLALRGSSSPLIVI